MKHIAIVVCSHNGHTKKIADFMACQLEQSGMKPQVFNLIEGQIPGPALLRRFDAVMVGAPVYYGEFPEQLIDWTSANAERLNVVSTGLFTVSTSAASKSERSRNDVSKSVKRLQKQTDLKPAFVANFAGALPYSKFSYLNRHLLRLMSVRYEAPADTTRDYELTDWAEVSQFVQAFMTLDFGSFFAVRNRSTEEAPKAPILGLPRPI